MEKWSKRLPLKFHFFVTTRQFLAAVTLLTFGGFFITYASLEWLPASIGYLLILEMQAVLFVNAFIPHLGTTIRFRLYSPGVVTAVLITLPFSVYLFQRAFAERILSWGQFWALFISAPFVMVSLAFVSLKVGNFLTN